MLLTAIVLILGIVVVIAAIFIGFERTDSQRVKLKAGWKTGVEMEIERPEPRDSGAIPIQRRTPIGDTVAEPVDAQYEVMEALRTHFDRSGDRVNVEQIVEMTALDQNAVENALRALKQANRINGLMVAEMQHPIWVTSINYD